MRLVLEQKSWSEVDAQSAAAAALPHIVIQPSVVRADDHELRRKQFVEWGLPADAQIEILTTSLAQSLVHWPVRLVEVQVKRGTKIVEARLVAIYGILEYLVAAMWRGKPAELAAKRDKIVTALISGRPDWRGREIVALAELYE